MGPFENGRRCNTFELSLVEIEPNIENPPALALAFALRLRLDAGSLGGFHAHSGNCGARRRVGRLRVELIGHHAGLCFTGRISRLVLSAVLLLLFTPPAFGGVPELNVKAICKARSADAKMLQSPPDQSTADCVRDEEAAKQQLGTLWASTSVSIRNRCQSDARSLHTTSYRDLLTCIQIAEDTKPSPKKETGKQ